MSEMNDLLSAISNLIDAKIHYYESSEANYDNLSWRVQEDRKQLYQAERDLEETLSELDRRLSAS